MDIREQIHALSDEMLENLGKLVAIDSTLGTPSEDKPFGEGPAKALEAGLEIAKSLGFKTVNLDNYCGYAEMFENDPIYAPICCRREGFSVESTDKTSSDPTEVVCEASNPGGNSNFGPVLGLIGKRIGEAVNTLCTDTAPLTCEPKDCNVPTDDGIGYKNEPLDKPKAACPCLYGCNTSAKWAGTEREYFLCNEFRFNIGTIKEDAPIVSSEDASYTKYTEVTDYNIDYESSYCQTRTGSPIQINLQKAEAGRKLVIEYPKRVSAQ